MTAGRFANDTMQQYTEAEVVTFPFHFYRPVNTRDKYERLEPREGGMCVCLVAYKKCERLTMFPCGHRMHKKCALLWVKARGTCPYCEAKERKDDVK